MDIINKMPKTEEPAKLTDEVNLSELSKENKPSTTRQDDDDFFDDFFADE